MRFKTELQECKKGFQQKNFYQGNILDKFPPCRTLIPKLKRGEEGKVFTPNEPERIDFD